jgi:type IV secretory pathway VirB10-like protein/polyhydroxyalkanoate synthesis regulator phasin
MAINFKFPKFSAADAKSRVFLVVVAVVGIGILGYAAVGFFSGGSTASGPSRVANPAANLQSVPGSQLSPQYYQALKQANVQASQQAQMTGGSAVPTLVNIPGQQGFSGGAGTGNCTVLCSDESVNVASSIDDLVKQGKLAPEDAEMLTALTSSNVPVSQFAAALDDLVRQGKLTPDQARKLLEDYKKQHSAAMINESAQAMDALIKSGQLSVDTANTLLALQKKNVTPAEYAAELDRLVKEGKISPAVAAQLLAQYTQQKQKELAKQGAFTLAQMAQSGEVTADVAKSLASLQNQNVPLDQYAAEVARLVKEGKLTPLAAEKLIAQYKQQRLGIPTTGVLGALLNEQAPKADIARRLLSMQASANPAVYAEELKRAVEAGLITPEMAAQLGQGGGPKAELAKRLLSLQARNASPEAYAAELKRAVEAGLISPEEAARLGQGGGPKAALARQLLNMQANNATLDAYAEELKRAVQAGIISPEMAAQLLQEYRASVVPFAPAGGIAPGAQASLPGAEDFAKLQQQLQQEQGATTEPQGAPPTEQFETAQVQAQQESAEVRQQRIQDMQSAMSNQAQALITSWQPVAMQHVAGTVSATDKGKPALGAGNAPGAAGGKDGAAAGPGGSPLIKAGAIIFAVLDTGVNSDYPDTPVMATIVQGPFKGAKLLGKVQVAQGPNKEKVSLTFNTMGMDTWPTNKSVNAFAIDPDTARTVLASDVDHHYALRYGAIMATSFLSGYANAISSSGSTSTTGVFGTSTTHPELSPGNKLAMGLGQIGTNLSAVTQNYVNIPTTITVNAGVGLGILFMSDVPQ